jgi:hypothetical protein
VTIVEKQSAQVAADVRLKEWRADVRVSIKRREDVYRRDRRYDRLFALLFPDLVPDLDNLLLTRTSLDVDDPR